MGLQGTKKIFLSILEKERLHLIQTIIKREREKTNKKENSYESKPINHSLCLMRNYPQHTFKRQDSTHSIGNTACFFVYNTIKPPRAGTHYFYVRGVKSVAFSRIAFFTQFCLQPIIHSTSKTNGQNLKANRFTRTA